MHRRGLLSVIATAALPFSLLQTVAGASYATEDSIPGTRGGDTSWTTAAAAADAGGLTIQVNERGRISRSVDASIGADDIVIDKPAGATVRGAYLAYASRGFSHVPVSQPIMLAGQPVPVTNEVANGISSYNYFADVTEHVQGLIDDAPAGQVTIPVAEGDSYYTEGEVLAVIFDDPNVTSDQTVSILYGALNPNGDTYRVDLARPIDLSRDDTKLEMSLGISFSYQTRGVQQYSTVDVNGQRLTSAAGGEDDGYPGNGYLITAGGEGDSLDNPADPYATPTHPRSDDELYDLRPFVRTGDQSLAITTQNPSLDDNVFLAVLEMNPPVVDVVANPGTMPVEPPEQDVPLGDTAFVKLGTRFAHPTLFTPARATVLSGPNYGRDFTFRCADGCFTGPTSWIYEPAAGGTTGEDVLEIWTDTNNNEVRDTDEPFGIATVRWNRAVHLAGLGDSYSSGEGLDPYDSGTDDDWGSNRNQCHRSSQAYARQAQPPGYRYGPLPTYVGGNTNTRVDFIACAGATTNNVISGGDAQYTEPGTQVDQGRLDDRTDLVTLSIGGNDVGFSTILKKCYLQNCSSASTRIGGVPVREWAQQRVDSLPGRLAPVLAQLKERAPQATIALFGYPRLFPTDAGNQGCRRLSRIGSDSMNWLNDTADVIDAKMSGAAAKAGVHFISVQDRFVGHAVCDTEEWIFGPTAPNIADLAHKMVVGTGSFHPNVDGQAAYAAALNDFLSNDTGAGTSDAGLPLNPLPVGLFSRLAATEEATVPLSDIGNLYVAPDPEEPGSACLTDEGLVASGGTMRLAGDGFAPHASVELTWSVYDPATDTTHTAAIGTAVADAQGWFQQVVDVPAGEPGTDALVTAAGGGAAGVPLELYGQAITTQPCGKRFTFDGFYAPVNNQPAVNRMNAGRAVPVKFSLGGDEGLEVFADGSPTSTRASCADGSAVDEVESTATAGGSSLSYDPVADQYTYVWKTNPDWADTCRKLTLTFTDQTQASALFHFR